MSIKVLIKIVQGCKDRCVHSNVNVDKECHSSVTDILMNVTTEAQQFSLSMMMMMVMMKHPTPAHCDEAGAD